MQSGATTGRASAIPTSATERRLTPSPPTATAYRSPPCFTVPELKLCPVYPARRRWLMQRAWFRRSQRGRVLAALFLLLIPAFALTAFTTRAYRGEQQRLAAESARRAASARSASGRAADAVNEFRTAMSLAPTRPAPAAPRAGAGVRRARRRSARAPAHAARACARRRGDQPGARAACRPCCATCRGPRATTAMPSRARGRPRPTRTGARRDSSWPICSCATAPRPQAEAELIALAADLPPDAALHVRVGDLLHARASRAPRVRRLCRRPAIRAGNVRARQGAGESAFELANYVTARRYFGGCHRRRTRQHARARPARDRRRGARARSVRPRPGRPRAGPACAARLRDRVEAAGRVRRGGRVSPSIAACSRRRSAAALGRGDTRSRRGCRVPLLSRDPDLLDQVMDLVFRTEEACEDRCAGGRRADQALVLIARDRRATER